MDIDEAKQWIDRNTVTGVRQSKEGLRIEVDGSWCDCCCSKEDELRDYAIAAFMRNGPRPLMFSEIEPGEQFARADGMMVGPMLRIADSEIGPRYASMRTGDVIIASGDFKVSLIHETY